MVSYQVEEFLLKIIDRIDFNNNALFFSVDKDTSYKSLLREYIFISCENRLIQEKNRRMQELLERWILEYGNNPKHRDGFYKKLETIEKKMKLKEEENHLAEAI